MIEYTAAERAFLRALADLCDSQEYNWLNRHTIDAARALLEETPPPCGCSPRQEFCRVCEPERFPAEPVETPPPKESIEQLKKLAN